MQTHIHDLLLNMSVILSKNSEDGVEKPICLRFLFDRIMVWPKELDEEIMIEHTQ